MNFSIIDDQNNSNIENLQNEFITGIESPTVIKVVGCGGAGGNAVKKQCDNIDHQQHQLGSGVKAVDHGISREILTECNIFKHRRSPPSGHPLPAPFYKPKAAPDPVSAAAEKPG